MSGEVPARARELAARLAALFRSDSQLAERLNDAQRRLLDANDRLWSGLHPDALGLVYDNAHRVVAGRDAIAERTIATLTAGGEQREIESALLEALQQAHWRSVVRLSITRAGMFRQGPLPSFTHGLLEYVAGVLFVAAPFPFSFDRMLRRRP